MLIVTQPEGGTCCLHGQADPSYFRRCIGCVGFAIFDRFTWLMRIRVRSVEVGTLVRASPLRCVAGDLGCQWLVAGSSAPRGVSGPDGGERPSSPCRRSGGVKLEAAVPGDRRGRGEQPRQSRVGAAPDGSGLVCETGRYTRGTGVVTRLQATPAATRWTWAGWTCRPAPRFLGGELLVWSCSFGLGGHGEGLRRNRSDAAVVEPGASPVDRTAVNVGTVF